MPRRRRRREGRFFFLALYGTRYTIREMLFNIILGLLFVCSSFFIWRRISRKLPLLGAISDEAIAETFLNDSRKWRLFIIHFKSFYKEKFFRESVWNFISKVFYRVHVLLMKADNAVMGALKKARANTLSLGREEERVTPPAVAAPEEGIMSTFVRDVPKEERLKTNTIRDVKIHIRKQKEESISFVELTTSLRQQKHFSSLKETPKPRKPRKKAVAASLVSAADPAPGDMRSAVYSSSAGD